MTRTLEDACEHAFADEQAPATAAPASRLDDAREQAKSVEDAGQPGQQPGRAKTVQPVLEKLFALYPKLFGSEFLPLKLGVFQELLATHPDEFQRETLKAALGVHTRSMRYLQSVAAGKPRHGLDGLPVEPLSPEHIYLALDELFRRRQGRTKEDLRPKYRAQLVAAFEASGLSTQEYLLRVQNRNEEAQAFLADTLAQHSEKTAKQEALLRTFDASGKSPAEFADMYGLNKRELMAALDRRRQQ